MNKAMDMSMTYFEVLFPHLATKKEHLNHEQWCSHHDSRWLPPKHTTGCL